jgi:hypothetical protein
LHGHDIAADLGDRCIQHGSATSHDENTRTACSEQLCGRQPNALTTACNESHFALQKTTH